MLLFVSALGCLYFSSPVYAFIPLHKSSSSSFPHAPPLRIASARAADASEPDLYQVLGVEPTATRSELKARYIQLARQFHPDAATADTTNSDSYDRFNEISTAYQLLRDSSQRRVYDRSLAAAQWSETIASAASAASVQVLEEFALPLLRRTTATTVAGITAAAASNKNKNTTTTSRRPWWKTAFSAASAASQSMDCMELLEEAQRLEDRAAQRYQAAVDVQAQVTAATQQRLHRAVTTPASGLTATEAQLWLEQQTLTEPHHSDDDTALKLQLQALSTVETQLQSEQHRNTQIQAQLHDSRTEQHAAQTALKKAQQKEDAAWAAYEQAKHASYAASHRFTAAANAVFQAERAAMDVETTMEPLQNYYTEQSEYVRRVLAERMQLQTDAADAAVQEQHRVELQKLRRQEEQLHAQASAIEEEAAKLLAKSAKLKRRAELLEARRSHHPGTSDVAKENSDEEQRQMNRSMEKGP